MPEAVRHATRQDKADRERRRSGVKRANLTEIVPLLMPEAVRHATGDRLPVSAHTLFYCMRPLVQAYCSEHGVTARTLDSHYFEQDLLTAYQRERGLIRLSDGRSAIYYEARGTLYEPHTGKVIQLGTREVEGYVFPSWLYDKILFVEKQGLWPVFREARLAERYDMAIVAGEGYATEACRVLFRNAEKAHDYQLFVLHDADPYGYNIARTLREKTRRMPVHKINVIDLGLGVDRSGAEVFRRSGAR
jgi:hypothetical protein